MPVGPAGNVGEAATALPVRVAQGVGECNLSCSWGQSAKADFVLFQRRVPNPSLTGLAPE